MHDLKDVTNNVHYENYRSKNLAAVSCNGVDNNRSKGQLTKWVFELHTILYMFFFWRTEWVQWPAVNVILVYSMPRELFIFLAAEKEMRTLELTVHSRLPTRKRKNLKQAVLLIGSYIVFFFNSHSNAIISPTNKPPVSLATNVTTRLLTHWLQLFVFSSYCTVNGDELSVCTSVCF